jgi:tetratricopeptide (TPR) repeat protein
LSPKTLRYYYRKGQAHLQLGQLYEAKLAFQKGLDQDSGNDQLKNALKERKPGEPAYQGNNANLSFEQKREKSLGLIFFFLFIYDYAALKDEGNKFFNAKKYGPAIEKYSQAIELDPSETVFYNNRAACYTELGRYYFLFFLSFCKI